MKRIAMVISILALAGCGKETPVTKADRPPDESPGAGLRRLALTATPGQLGFTSDSEFPVVYGVLTEWDIDGISITVMAMRDGTASLYTTSTFGIVGGQGHESVRRAAVRCVKTGERFVESGKPDTEFAYPGPGQVLYYLLAYDGVRQVVGSEAAIERGADPSLPLFAAAQDVLTELRLTAEKGTARPSPVE